jgi:catechol 2,3-dioxygenase-like lactoylglutathione lyase family enzyme
MAGRSIALPEEITMKEQIELMLRTYEQGRMTRRDLVAGLVMLAAPGAAAAPAPMKAVNINHVTMTVSDIERTRAFYQELLDVPVIGQSGFEIDLAIGGSFIALMKTNRPPGINHFCIGVPDYDPKRVAEFVTSRGLKPQVSTGIQGVTFKEAQIYVPDPDGIRVQFSRPEYMGEMPSPKRAG